MCENYFLGKMVIKFILHGTTDNGCVACKFVAKRGLIVFFITRNFKNSTKMGIFAQQTSLQYNYI